MLKAGIISVHCKCGNLLFVYYKDKDGPLIKCYLDAIKSDYVGIEDQEIGYKPCCPNCKNLLGSLDVVHDRLALVVDQETVFGKKTLSDLAVILQKTRHSERLIWWKPHGLNGPSRTP